MHKNNFNFLRLIGAILVMFSHSFDVVGKYEDEPIKYILKGQYEASSLGICIFFIISGYFVTKSAYTSFSGLEFLKKRAYRIYPALIVLVLATVFIIGPLCTQFSLYNYFHSKDTWLYLYTITGLRIRMFLPGVFTDTCFYNQGVNASIWSISLELYLYFSLAFFIAIRATKSKYYFVYIGTAIILICNILATVFLNLDFQYFRLFNLINIFYLGSIMYLLQLDRKQEIILILLSLSVYILFKLIGVSIFKYDFLLLIAICISVLLIGFSKKIKIHIDTDISYGLYIYASPIQQIIFKLSGCHIDPYRLFLLTLLFTSLIAFVSWKYIEKPFIALKKSTLFAQY